MSEKAAVYIPVVCVIEEKAKIFDLLKNILKSSGGEKSIFLYGGADFSWDIKKYIDENDVLIFRLADVFMLPEIKNERVDLIVLGEYKSFGNLNNISYPDNIKTILLNIDNSGGLKNLAQNIQVITCGLKEKDTVIFSSINLDEGSVILDLQRSIKNINGETLEPFEKQIVLPCFALTLKAEDLILPLTALTFCGKI